MQSIKEYSIILFILFDGSHPLNEERAVVLQALHFLEAFLMKDMIAICNIKSPFLKSKLRLRFRQDTVLILIKLFITIGASKFINKSGADTERAFIVGLTVLIVFIYDKKGGKK